MKRIFAGLLWVAVPSLAPLPAAAQDLRIVHVTIVSPERAAPLRDATVTIHDGIITAIVKGGKAGANAIDGSGLYLTPGLIDSHVHLDGVPGMTEDMAAKHPDIARQAEDQIPRSYLLHGFTTLIDLNSTPQSMARWKKHDPVPDTYYCGGAMLMDGYPMNFAPKPLRYRAPYMLIEPGTEAPAGIDPAQHTPAAVVRRMRSDGAICVKTFFEHGFGQDKNLPVPKAETIRELVRAAHDAGLPVLMHANALEAQAFGVENGVDILAHGLWNAPGQGLTPEIRKTLDGVLANKMGWQPTIQVLHGERDLFDPDYLSDPRLTSVLPASLIDWYRGPEGHPLADILTRAMPPQKDAKALQAFVFKNYDSVIARTSNATGYLAAHGGRLLFGTDTPSDLTYANPPGLNAWLEMQNLVAAGETPAQIFRSATLANAQALKLDTSIGTVQVGKRANLLLLRQDPARTIQAYLGIAKIILGGRVLDPGELAANRPH